MAPLDRLADLEARGIPVHEDEVWRALLAAARRAAGLLPRGVRDDASSAAAQRLFAHWLSGRKSLADVSAMLTVAVRNQGRSMMKKERRHEGERFEAPAGPDGPTLGEMVASPELRPEQMPELRGRMSELQRELDALRRYLADPKTRDKVRLIERLACEGMPRDEIARRVTAAGYPTTGKAVTKAVSRLIDRFPLLRERWTNRAPDGTLAPKTNRVADRKALTGRLIAAVDAAEPAIRLIYDARAARRPTRDWSVIASIVQMQRDERWTSTTARDAWRRFILDLPEDLRHVAP